MVSFSHEQAMRSGEGATTGESITYHEVQEERGDQISRRLEDSEGYRYGFQVRCLKVFYHIMSSRKEPTWRDMWYLRLPNIPVS